MVEVLLAAGSVRAGGLKMAPRIAADPYVLPGGRNRELADPQQRLRIGDPVAPLVQVGEAAAALYAAQPGSGAV